MNLPEFLVDRAEREIRLAGHRISLYQFDSFYQEGCTPEMLHEEFPSIPRSLIYRVIRFYHENQAEVDAYVAEQASVLERLEASTPPSPALLDRRRKLEEMRRTEAP
jgi:uncharacterized protein (DUF433 family)